MFTLFLLLPPPTETQPFIELSQILCFFSSIRFDYDLNFCLRVFLVFRSMQQKKTTSNVFTAFGIAQQQKLLLLFLHSNAKRKMKWNTISFQKLIDSRFSSFSFHIFQLTRRIGKVIWVFLHQSKKPFSQKKEKTLTSRNGKSYCCDDISISKRSFFIEEIAFYD